MRTLTLALITLAVLPITAVAQYNPDVPATNQSFYCWLFGCPPDCAPVDGCGIYSLHTPKSSDVLYRAALDGRVR